MTGVGAIASSYAPGGLTVVAEDTFTRADSTTLGNTEVGSYAWVEQSGDAHIVSNSLRTVYAAGGVDTKVTFDGGVSDATVTANVGTATTANRTICQVVVRYHDTSNFWVVEMLDYSEGDALALTKFWLGNPITVGTYAAGFGPNETHEIVVEAIGSSWTVYLDGVSRITASDSALSTATRFGARWYTSFGGDDGTSRILDIKVET